MKATKVTPKQPERKILGFIADSGALIMRNNRDEKNTVINGLGATPGSNIFDDWVKRQPDSRIIYEGDTIQIQF